MSKCIFAPLARQDIREINNYLAQFSPSAARRLKDKIKTQCKRLTNFPQMGRSCEKLYPGLRSFPVDDYIIFYRPTAAGVEIVRIISGYRDLEAIFNDDD